MLKFFLLTVLLVHVPSWAHGHGDEDAAKATVAHFARIVELEPSITAESSISVPYVKISGQRVYMNGPFWELVQGWVRLYYREMQHECDDCIDWSEERFTQAATDVAAKSFMELKVTGPALEGLEHISVGTADIGSQLGKTAAVAKITAEVAETVVSKFVGGGGVHLVCHVLDAIILFGTRHIQTATRAFTWAPAFDRSRLATAVKMGFVSQVIRRAQKKVSFVAGPVRVDEEELAELDAEGPNRWWGAVKAGKRATWLKKLAAAGENPLRLSRPEFLGGRMKRYLFLKGRRRGHATYMKGSGEMDGSLNHSMVWILEVQESMIQRAFEPDGESPRKALSLADTSTPDYDEVRAGLAQEFAGDPEQAEFFDRLLRDVDVVFQPNIPSRIRYFHVAKLEALLAGFLYSRFSAALSEQGDIHGSSFGGIIKQIKLHWRAGRFGSYLLEWADFLKLASLQNDPERLLKHKYESMEALMRVLRSFKRSGEIAAADAHHQLKEFEDVMAAEYQGLRTFTPWKEKRTAYSWIPFRNRAPQCSQMNREVM
ncbi:MAG: hypothetical protein KF799_01050 [Bdellovibrionales bacterium]|nr:hypothetical protein [Bdellovibrionales bacterium]